MVLTFEENPKRILSPANYHGELSTQDQKLSLIDSMGVDLCVLIDFSGDFSKLPGRKFLSMLSERGELRFLAVGSDFRCGYRLDTDAQAMREFFQESSIKVDLLSAVYWAGHPVSSSRIRKAIIAGHLEDAAQMLGRPYEIDLRGAGVLASQRIVPTGGQVSPPPGLYESQVSYNDGSRGLDSLTLAVALDTDGGWSVPLKSFPQARASVLIGLSLIRMVSRE
jgi:riboflavin kinase/FMN adenylyltransferase